MTFYLARLVFWQFVGRMARNERELPFLEDELTRMWAV